MARIPRKFTVYDNSTIHKIWRGHNHEWNIHTAYEKLRYLQYLNEDIEDDRYKGCADINALTLMDNHVHEIFKIQSARSFSEHMRRHHTRYGLFFNRLRNRSGKVAGDRPKTCLIENDAYEMRAVFYVHANPVRAKMVGDARDYEWSTHNLYAFGKRAPWMKHIKFPNWYMKLGDTMPERQRKYRALFALYLHQEGLTKKPIYSRIFFGEGEWMLEHESKVKSWRSQRTVPK